MGGTYALVLDVPEQIDLTVGALGDVSLPAGGYAYVGSAFGTGGLGRVDRHKRVAAGEHDVRHWHIDYLLNRPPVSLVSVVAIPAVDVECALGRELGSGPIDGFGASDCSCESHLAQRDSAVEMRHAVERGFRTVTDE